MNVICEDCGTEINKYMLWGGRVLDEKRENEPLPVFRDITFCSQYCMMRWLNQNLPKLVYIEFMFIRIN